MGFEGEGGGNGKMGERLVSGLSFQYIELIKTRYVGRVRDGWGREGGGEVVRSDDIFFLGNTPGMSYVIVIMQMRMNYRSAPASLLFLGGAVKPRSTILSSLRNSFFLGSFLI